MLAVIRFILMTLALVFISTVACFYSILRPFHRNNVFHTARYMSKVSTLLGLSIEVRTPESIKNVGPAVYICNHQNSYDIFTVGAAVQPSTVSVGKKSLKWIPFFGQMYWLTGNILIDRSNSSKAMNTIALTAKKITEKELSVWLFPEGTRSNGKGLLPFKTGAFRTAQQANVPIIPVCVSNSHGKIKLGRWNNGKLIIELLDPIYFNNDAKESIREVANSAYQKMLVKIAELSKESGNELIVNKNVKN
ncbi:MAG: 1-acylglycerol-3-phosphate O-acyltransferase [Colwellia sp.]